MNKLAKKKLSVEYGDSSNKNVTTFTGQISPNTE